MMSADQFRRSVSNSHSRGNGAAGLTSREPLTLDQIRNIAPSIFATSKHESRSDRYAYIPTSAIIEHLLTKDYGVFSVNQSGSRDIAKRSFTKHMVRLRSLSQALQVGETHNEIVLINSHDGTSAYRLMAGIFRMVCGNGLIVAESVVHDVRVMHSGNIVDEVSNGVIQMTEQLPALSNRVEAMQAITLTPDERGVFAAAALTAKYGDEPPITAQQVMAPRREQDRGMDLWRTLNVAQENLMRGGSRYIHKGEDKNGNRRVQRRKTAATNSVDGQTNLNRALWRLAEEMKKLKTG